MAEPRLYRPGETITWRSQSKGTWKKKVGTVLALLPPHADAHKALLEMGVTERLMGQRVSRYPRYLVRVQTGPRSFRVYAPLVRMVHGKQG